jgi:hypothetical protein
MYNNVLSKMLLFWFKYSTQTTNPIVPARMIPEGPWYAWARPNSVEAKMTDNHVQPGTPLKTASKRSIRNTRPRISSPNATVVQTFSNIEIGAVKVALRFLLRTLKNRALVNP